MEWWQTLLLILSVLFLLMATGYPVAFIFLTVTLVMFNLFLGGLPGVKMFILSINDSLYTFTLVAVPMFILMGEALFRSGIAMRAINSLDNLLGVIPGRLSALASGIGILFGAVSGSMMANTAMLGSVLIPEMQKRGYHKVMIFGPLMGGGSLAVLIPPSAIAVLFASIAQISAGKVLIAGTLPGVVLGLLYVIYIIVRAQLNPALAPIYEVEKVPFKTKIKSLWLDVAPLGVIIFAVIGTIMLGIATPSEAAALGALGTFLVCAYNKTFNFKLLKEVSYNTFKTTAMIFTIIAASVGFGQMLAYTGAVAKVAEIATTVDVSPLLIVAIMTFIVIILGTFLDTIPLMMIIIPIFFPIIAKLGLDPIWFAVIMIVAIKIGAYTPPYGMLLFVMKGVAPKDTTMMDIYRSIFPFIIIDIILIALLIIFPKIALLLPSLMDQ